MQYYLSKSSNNVIYADIKRKDIIRVYNMHLQSIKISPDVNEIDENIDAINQINLETFIRISKAFKQQQQAEQFREHKLKCTYQSFVAI
jgi:hypothetical protein